MRISVLAVLLVGTVLLAVPADAALVSPCFDGVEGEVGTRDAALVGDLDRAQAKLKKAFTRVKALFDQESDSSKTDAKLIKKITAKLRKALPEDAEMRGLLIGGLEVFLAELDTTLGHVEKGLDLVGDDNKRKGKLLKVVERAVAAIDAAIVELDPKKKAGLTKKAEKAVATALKAAGKAVAVGGPAMVHAFEYDLATGEYVVKGVRVSQSDVDRDLYGSLCSSCHDSKAAELKDSVHYKIAGKTDRVMFPGGGAHGMIDRACGLHSTTGLTNYLSDVNLGECSKCHVGRYMPAMEGFFAGMFGEMGVSDPAGQAEQLVNAGLDCLVCHAEDYKSRPTEGVLAQVADWADADAASPTTTGMARDAHDNGDFNHDGVPDLVIDVNGDGTMDAPLMIDGDGDGRPETPWQTVAQDRGLHALKSIGHTTEHACLRCHEHARTGYKRGTLFIEGHDVHATASTGEFEGAENQCTACHTAQHHKFVRGHLVGGDLAAADYPPPKPGVAPDPNDPTDLTCTTCHDTGDLPASIHTARHLGAMACETCHIPYGSGITYALFGHGGQIAFSRNDAGMDTRVVTADVSVASDRADLEADDAAFRVRPLLMWFDGGASFLAQCLSVRGMPNAKITPFKPMANGMAFDARYFSGATEKNDANFDYNAYSMYRFYANGTNAEAFYGLGLLDMLPADVRKVTFDGFMSTDPDVQTMALMLIFPNLVYFDKGSYGVNHYAIASGSPFDANADGFIDLGVDFYFDMLKAANDGLKQFAAFNGPMGFEEPYDWYPKFDVPEDIVIMKLPDGSLIKMFLQMQAAMLPVDMRGPFLAAVANYPSYSMITLGGHGVLPKDQAIGAQDCKECHGADGVFSTPVPVGRKVATDLGQMGTVELPVYRWRYYDIRKLVDLGIATQNEDIVANSADVDVSGDTAYVRDSDTTFVLNWFMPSDPAGYRPASDPTALAGTSLTSDDLIYNGGRWMPVLEPVVDMKPNYEVLGYAENEILFMK